MNATADSLSRTLLLMRDEVGRDIAEGVLLDALTTTRIALVADASNIAWYPAQTAFVTAATMMARSGHKVWLIAPNVAMQGPQPPLRNGHLVDELLNVGRDLVPDVEFTAGAPDVEVDLAIGIGDTPVSIPARRRIWINAEAWAGSISGEEQSHPWNSRLWSLGALAAGGLAANEAFKVAMQKLLPFALSPENTSSRFAATNAFRFELAPADTPLCRNLGEVDFVSGGAITNSVLFCLARIPGVTAHGRIIEPETADLSNLNRYMLLLRSAVAGDAGKARGLAEILRGSGLRFVPIEKRYDAAHFDEIGCLAATVVVGVDHIPTRWVVQQAWPEWLVIGASTHWSAMASFHAEGLGCAHCLHNEDDPGDLIIPSQASVSFWAGLLSVAFLARHATGAEIANDEQQAFLTPFRPERIFRTPVPIRKGCPTCQLLQASASQARAFK